MPDRRRSRGFFTVEALAVSTVATLALMQLGPFAPPPYPWYLAEAERMSAAESDAFRLRFAAQVQREDTGRCPTTASLLAAGEVRAARDPWKKPYWVFCQDQELTVVSDGPDGRPFTGDDVGARKIPWSGGGARRGPHGHARRR